MPDNSSELLWWAFNGAIVLLMFLARNDLKEIKDDIKTAKNQTEANAKELATLRATCEERHKRLDFEIADIKTKAN